MQSFHSQSSTWLSKQCWLVYTANGVSCYYRDQALLRELWESSEINKLKLIWRTFLKLIVGLNSPYNPVQWLVLSPQCSVTCGVGRTTRQVVCSNYHQPVEQSFCDPDERPTTEQECTAAPCPSIYHRQRINDQPYGYPQDPGRHPGHNSWNVPSADNQWRTGPWGAVRTACDFHNVVFGPVVEWF